MKNNFYMLPLLCTCILSCNNNTPSVTSADIGGIQKDTTKKIAADTKPADNTISFMVNGSPVQTSAWNISSFAGMTGVAGINITSNMHEDPRTINININGDTAGTYSLLHTEKSATTRGIAYGTYRPDYNKDMMNVFRFESGNMVIESIDKNKGILNARFSGRATNSKGESVTITDGKVINGKIKPVDKSLIN